MCEGSSYVCKCILIFFAPIEEYVVFCPITELQEEIYQAILETEDAQLILHSGEPCDCYSGKKRGECCYVVSFTCVV